MKELREDGYNCGECSALNNDNDTKVFIFDSTQYTMDLTNLKKVSDYEWEIPQQGDMRVHGKIFGNKQ
ncbi:MAG: hypothetical protein HXS54_09995, partial [Theionarchaea archaeon]|nr:hypothetical protein [Theionarchaea archaeon]